MYPAVRTRTASGTEAIARRIVVNAAYRGSHCRSDMRAAGSCTDSKIILIINVNDVDLPGTYTWMRCEATYCC